MLGSKKIISKFVFIKSDSYRDDRDVPKPVQDCWYITITIEVNLVPYLSRCFRFSQEKNHQPNPLSFTLLVSRSLRDKCAHFFFS